MEQKIMSFRLSRSGRRAIALNNQRCRCRRARTPVAKRVLVPVAALSFWSCFRPQASDSLEVDAPESSSTAKKTKSSKKKVCAVLRNLKEWVQRLAQSRFRFKGGKHPVPKNDEDNHDAAAETIVDLLNKLPCDSVGIYPVTRDQLFGTLLKLKKSAKGRNSRQVQAISLAIEMLLTNFRRGETISDSLIESIAKDIEICPSYLYAPGEVTPRYMRDTLCKLLSGGKLTTDQVQEANSEIQCLDTFCFSDVPLSVEYISSIASNLKIDPVCFRPQPWILKISLLNELRQIVAENRLANIERQNIQGAIKWLEEKHKSNRVQKDVVEVIASRVKIIWPIFQHRLGPYSGIASTAEIIPAESTGIASTAEIIPAESTGIASTAEIIPAESAKTLIHQTQTAG